MITIDDCLAEVRETLKPEGRGIATAATLNQIAQLPGAGGVEPECLHDAFWVLAEAQESDPTPAVAARGRTCRELARAIEVTFAKFSYSLAPANKGLVGKALPWFEAQAIWAEADDPRQKAMAETAARELGILKAYIKE